MLTPDFPAKSGSREKSIWKSWESDICDLVVNVCPFICLENVALVVAQKFPLHGANTISQLSRNFDFFFDVLV